MLVALESGRTDLVVTDMPTAKAACVAYPDLKLLDFTDTDDDFAVSDASGVSEGGRTGLTAMTTAVLFALALLLSPIFLAIPSFATAPALIVVGFYMVNQVGLIDFSDFGEGIPAFICIAAMPFFYSISEGLSRGVISYVVLNVATGKAQEKKISIVMYVLAVLFLLKYFLI